MERERIEAGDLFRGQDGDLSWIDKLPEKIAAAMQCASLRLFPI